MKFLDEKWFASYEKTLREKFDAAHTPTKASAKVLEIYKNVPGEGDVWMCIDWEEGVLVSFEHGKDPKKAPRDADFRLEGTYETWVRALSLKDDLTGDLMSGKMKFSGNLAKFQPVIKPFIGAVLMQGLVRPDGRVILTAPLKGVSGIVMEKF